MLVDVHTHCLQHEHWGPEWDDNWKPVYNYEWVNVTPDRYDQHMSEAGVDLAFVFGLRATKAGVRIPNQFVAQFCADTRTDTVGFMSLDLSDPDCADQFAEGLKLGLRGVKLYPVLAHFDPRETTHDWFYEAAAKEGLVVLWHMGASPSKAGDLRWADPMLLDPVAARHPELVQIIAHMAHPWQRETILLCRKHPKVFTDVSAAWARPFDGFHALVRAQEWGVVPKLLFGSDYPMWTTLEAVEGLRELGQLHAGGNLPRIEDATIDQILGADPRAALGLRTS